MIPTIIHNPRSERHNHLIKQLEFAGVKEYDFSPPVYGPDPLAAVAQAHQNAAKQSYERHGYCFVMENDIVFTHPNSVNYFLDHQKELPEDWDVYLMGYYHHNRDFKEIGNLRKLKAFTAFHGYILHPRMLDKIMPDPNGRIKNVDVYLGFMGYRIYAINPVVAIQNHDFKSERLGKFKRYAGLVKKLKLYGGND